MTDGSTVDSYGLNGEKLTCRIIRYHDVEIDASCLRVEIFQSGKNWALIRTVTIVTGLLITVKFLPEVREIIFLCTVHFASVAVVHSISIHNIVQLLFVMAYSSV